MVIISAERLRSLTHAIVVALGTGHDVAEAVTDSLVEANLAGHDSHGVLRLPWYARQVHSGQLLPSARPFVRDSAGATARVDGNQGWGPPAALLAAATALDLARAHGIGAATILNGNHIGRLGPYVEGIARAGGIGLAICNASPFVSPFGGFGRLMGTNPFAMAAPGAPGDPPLVLDFATSAVAEGKLRVAVAAGVDVAPGLLRNAAGQLSRDPRDCYAGGALEAFGLHKGSGLSLMIELLARGLCRVDPTDPERRGYNGTLLIALAVEAFAPPEQFAGAAGRLAAQVHATPPLAGVERVLLPGEPELRTRAQRLADGVPIAESTWAELTALAAELGVRGDGGGAA